jgi:hypothetical protein
MLVKVIGVDASGTRYAAVVDGVGPHEVLQELVYCMGITAHSKKVFESQLMDIGFDVYTADPGGLPVVEIPINLNDNDMF